MAEFRSANYLTAIVVHHDNTSKALYSFEPTFSAFAYKIFASLLFYRLAEFFVAQTILRTTIVYYYFHK